MKTVNKQLNNAMHDEKMAPVEYARLRKNLKGKANKKVISSIIKQERQHLRKLKKIKKSMKK